MIVFPAIDLIDGKVVRLEQGSRRRIKIYSCDPVSVASSFIEQGATWLHVVDLSAAFEEDSTARAANLTQIKALCALPGLSVDVGGGVRSLAAIEKLASFGAKRIALGTVLIKDPVFAKSAAQHFGDVLVADIAAQNNCVKVNGWREKVEKTLQDILSELVDFGFRHLVFTDIAKDGMQSGIDLEQYKKVAELAGFPVVASGGISCLEDVSTLANAGSKYIEGCIIGRALYERSFSLKDALAACAKAQSTRIKEHTC